jgi:PAS domain S-box-containing protein
VLENVEDGIVACDAGGVLVLFNRAAREFHSLPAEPIPPERWSQYYDLYHADGVTPMTTEAVPLYRALQGETVVNAEMVIAPRGGETRTLLASARPLYDPRGEKIGAVVVMHDITERRRAEDALRRESALMRSLMDNIPDAIYFKDTEGRFTRVNRHAPYKVNAPPEDVIGKTDFDFFAEGHARAAREDERRIVSTGEPLLDKEEQELYPDGSTTWLSTTKVPVFDDSGRVAGIVGISRDITERKAAEESRIQLAREQAARAEAEASNRVKDEFMAVLSHELRTPLTAILGWSRLLRESGLDSEHAGPALETIERNARAQAQLIDDLLDVSRIIAGKLELDSRPVELVRVVAAAADSIRPAAEAKGLDLSVDLGAPAGRVAADFGRLQQVCWNLLSNAVKFTPRGGRVEARVRSDGAHAEIVVSDTGVGISPEFLPHVFERFRQADASTTRTHGGLGVGLSLVRHLTELHGGEVRAESRGAGRGATFTVRLPLLPGPAAEGRDVHSLKSGSVGPRADALPLRGLRVLVVDDEKDTLEVIAAALNLYGAEATTARSVREASLALERGGLDVVISDLGMPGEDGYEMIRRLRARPAARGGMTPALALSAYARDEDKERALSAGYNAHLSKPVEPARLVAAVARLAGEPTRGARPEDPPPP